MNGLGAGEESRYVGDPRIVSHLELPSIPMGAGRGTLPARTAGRPAYVSMPSGLDTDQPIDHLIHFHPNQNTGRRIGPAPMRYAGPAAGPIPMEAMDPSEQAALEGYNEVIGPDYLAGLSAVNAVNHQPVPAHMTAVTVAQAPEGIDNQFSRAAQVLDPWKGDKVMYDGYWNDPMIKPAIDPVTNLAGVHSNPKDMLPGMGYLGEMAGPGMGEDATGNELTTAAQAHTPTGQPPANGKLKELVVWGAILAGAYLLHKKSRG